MPHKRNPVRAERICGLARVVRAQVVPVMEGIALWHERDISHSSTERVALSDTAIATDYLTPMALGKSATAVRFLFQAVCGVAMFAYFVWGVQILWGI